MASSSPRRGEIWLVSLGAARQGEPGKNRPAIVVSIDEVLTGAEDELIVIVPISSSRTSSLLRPAVSAEERVDKESVAVCRAVRSVSCKRLLHPLGYANPATLARIERSLQVILGIDRTAAV